MPYVCYIPGGGVIHGPCPTPKSGEQVWVSDDTDRRLRCGYNAWQWEQLVPAQKEAAVRLATQKEYVESHPNDWIAQWLYNKGGEAVSRKESRAGMGGALTEPEWMGQAGVTMQAPPTTTTQQGWLTGFKPVTTTTPGETTGLRPLGGQMNLTSDQMEQLMYYLAYVQSGGAGVLPQLSSTSQNFHEASEYGSDYGSLSVPGQKARREEVAGERGEEETGIERRRALEQAQFAGTRGEAWLKTVAYKLPNWWNDFLGISQALMPTKTAPKATAKPAWQR